MSATNHPTATRPAVRYYAAAYPYGHRIAAGHCRPLRVLRVFGSVLARSIWIDQSPWQRRTVPACDVTRSERASIAALTA